MGAFRFALHPPRLGVEQADLREAYITGYDRMPWRTRIELTDGQLICIRQVSESGALNVPWHVPSFGQVMLRTATLMERTEPYHLQLELARGKLNQLRNYAADWTTLGLELPPELREDIRHAQGLFGHALTVAPGTEAGQTADQAMAGACWACERLAQVYAEQLFRVRHQQYPRLTSLLGCRLGPHDRRAVECPEFRDAFNAASIRFSWRDIEPEEGDYHWEPFDDLVDWCLANKLVVTGGPLLNWTSQGVPDWLWLWEEDLGTVLSFMSDFVQAVIHRYQSRIRIWEVTARTNCGDALAMSEEERLRLTVRALRVARQADSEASLVVTLSQPWAEYMARTEYEYSPLHFADALLRADLGLTAIGLELIHGFERGASWSRDLLDVSALLDQYAALGVPLRVILAAPSAQEPDALARTDIEQRAGTWHGPWTQSQQADWADRVARLTTCKPYVQETTWSHFCDAEPHEFPNAGLVGADGTPKPALARLTTLRREHLR
jgi:hypothetical protein